MAKKKTLASTGEVVVPAEPELSKATYTDRREERIAYYYFVRRVTKPPAIYDYLIHECRECLGPDVGSAHPGGTHKFVPLVSLNRDSGLRMVQEVVMRIRANAEPEEILKLRRPIETEKVRATYEYLLQKQIDVIEDRSTVKVQKVSPYGAIVTVEEPRCSALEKGKAVKAATILAEKIGKLTGAELVAVDDGKGDGDSDATKPEEKFMFSFPNVKTGAATDIADLVAMNLDRGKVN